MNNTPCSGEILLDIGGEGRYPEAWNLNLSMIKTIGKNRGDQIPQLVLGSACDLPFSDQSVSKIIVERTPLRAAALAEISRVIVPNGTIILRHAKSPISNPHALAEKLLPGWQFQRFICLKDTCLQETTFHLSDCISPFIFDGCNSTQDSGRLEMIFSCQKGSRKP